MNYLDLIIVIPLVWGAYKGFRKGLVVSVASLLALLLGIYGALRFSDYARTLLTENVGMQANYVPITAFVLTFIAIVIAVHFMAKIVDKLIDAIALAWLNTLAGIAFGVLKFAFILSILIFLFEKIDTNGTLISTEVKQSSVLYQPVQSLAPALFPSLNNFEIEDKVPSFQMPSFDV